MKISASFLKIQTEKEKVKQLDTITDYMHFDIMDGKFVSNKTIDFKDMEEIAKEIQKPKDVHLMVLDIYKYVDMYKNINPEYITFHYEATKEIEDVINYIKSLGIKVGIAINPDTNPELLNPYLNLVDLVLVMSVFPGKGGQQFIDISSKIDYLNKKRQEENLKYIIEADGGINDETIKFIKDIDMAVVGSFITDSDNYSKQIKKVRGAL